MRESYFINYTGNINIIKAVISSIQDDIQCAKQLNERGIEFIAADHYAVDCIQPKCNELERIYTDYCFLLSRRDKLIRSSVELHSKIDKVRTP